MPRLWFFLLWVTLVSGAGCSLHSLERLERCSGKPVSRDCPDGSAGKASGGLNAGGGGAENVSGTASVGGTESTSGSGGSSGMATAGATDGGAGGGQATHDLMLLYADRSASNDEDPSASLAIRPSFSIENHGESNVDLSELSVRYYYTLEAASTQTFLCDFVRKDAVVNNCKGIKASFGTLSGAAAKNYIEISFEPPNGESWAISAIGGSSGSMLLRFYNGNFAKQDQTNDYSFDPSKDKEPEEWSHVTLYRNGQLVYGVEPD